MLLELSIRHFAIIDDIRIRFSEGLTILSGETGAGKSIIINAVNLLLGSRASSKLIRTGADAAELEALFEISPGSETAQIMAHSGYDPKQGLLIRRIISRKGRHRIYINGNLAGMQILSAITQNLASISGQHVHQGLLKEDLHLFMVDRFGGLLPLRKKVAAGFDRLVPLIKKLENLKQKQKEKAERIELLQFQKKEILDAQILPGEDKDLDIERLKLKNAKNLYASVYTSIETLYGSEGAVVDKLGSVGKELEKSGRIDPELVHLAKRAMETVFDLEDLTDELRSYLGGVEVNEQKLEAVEDRIDELNRIKRKYGGSLEAVGDHLQTIEKSLSDIDHADALILNVQGELEKCHEQVAGLAEKLSKKRRVVSKTLAKQVEKQLAGLKMDGSRFEVDLTTQAAEKDQNPFLCSNGNTLSASGMDQARFMMSANVGEGLKPLTAIASGGELSRVVLGLKAILAETDSVSTVVFDEVDAGIGGGVAEVVGRKLSKLSQRHQVACITHLPQIARFGNHHFQIKKAVSHGRTTTSIAPVSEKERVQEIARMLGGEKITPTTMAHAREMLDSG